jgi:hypothetical protein
LSKFTYPILRHRLTSKNHSEIRELKATLDNAIQATFEMWPACEFPDLKVWDKVKGTVIPNGYWAIFKSSKELARLLLATGNSALIEQSLFVEEGLSSGDILMSIRDELRALVEQEEKADEALESLATAG